MTKQILAERARYSSLTWVTALGLFLLSAATLTFEINLTRLFSVAQFYHFAFLIVSIALLGFGTSGTFLTLRPNFGRENPTQRLGVLSLLASIAMLGSYLLFNHLPFDSFSIAWDKNQFFILSLHYFVLALPFFFSGLAVGMLLSTHPHQAGLTYGTNLLGSALGCGLALVVPTLVDGEGSVLIASALAAAAAVICVLGGKTASKYRWIALGPALLLLVLVSTSLQLRVVRGSFPDWLTLRLSPYKGLSYAFQYPEAESKFSRWNSHSRVDIVRSQAIRSLPGLSYRYLKTAPRQDGLLVDGDDLSPIVLPDESLDFAAYMPAAVAFQLRPDAETLVLEPRGGLDVIIALAIGSKPVTAVESNALIVEAAKNIYQDPQVRVFVETDRSFARRSENDFDVVVLSLASSYHPVRSGAYSLVEDYRYTVESFQDYLGLLKPNGILVVTRWLQTPPSESLRAFALALSAVEERGGDPGKQIVAFRGYNIATLLVKSQGFTSGELEKIRHFTSSKAFDLIYAPGIQAAETNLYNILPESSYYEAFIELLNTHPREKFFQKYPYDVRPPSDDRPFFGHFFKWSQAGQVLSEMGKTWQPFGGAGYFVLLALLGLAVFLAGVLILLPVLITTKRQKTVLSSQSSRKWLLELVYFGLIGLGFMLVEMPLIQRLILLLGQPAYAMSAVLFTLLLFSGLGSLSSQRISLRKTLFWLSLMLMLLPFLLSGASGQVLSFPPALRIGAIVLLLAPVGFLMGVPFSGRILWLQNEMNHPVIIPWGWAVNGAASVLGSILAALLAISVGFHWVFLMGALSYFSAWLIIMVKAGSPPLSPPVR